MKVRLNKYLAQCGVASRREAEKLITEGKVKVNDVIVKKLAYFVTPGKDVVKVKGRVVRPLSKVYVIMNKPKGVVCSVKDPFNRTIVDLLPDKYKRKAIYPVGRLDLRSEGLIILTNDGDLTYMITHPSGNITKTYHVLLDRALAEKDLKLWREGVIIEGDVYVPVRVRRLPYKPEGRWIEVVLNEGIKREIRKMAEVLGYSVQRLIRVAIGKMRLRNLKPGNWVELKRDLLWKMITKGGIV